MFNIISVAEIIRTGMAEVKKEEHELESTFKAIVLILVLFLSFLIVIGILIGIHLIMGFF